MLKQKAPIFRLQIRFNWKIALGILILFSIFVRLGFWQLDRAEQKQQIQNDRDARSLVPLAIGSLNLDDINALQQQKLTMNGSYDHDKSIRISNQIFRGQPGFEVITPFKLHSSNKIVLVSRGWISAESGPKKPAEIEPITGPQQLVGEIHIPTSNRFFLPQKLDEPPIWPIDLHHFDINTISPLFDRPLFPFVVRLDDNNPGVLERHWQVTRLKPMNSISYAIQWFGMALILVIISLIKSTNILGIIAANKSSQ